MGKIDKTWIEFVLVPGGTFEMGDVFNEGDDDEKPIHSVTVRDFCMSKFPVTFKQYDMFCEVTGATKPNDVGWGRNNRPVINVTYFEAVRFCDWLSKETGDSVRLPTEAEWEYAARECGRKVRFGNGQDIARPSQINFDAHAAHKEKYSEVGEYRGKPLPVGSFQPNKLGLHDMSGNVWEWCSDPYNDSYTDSMRVLDDPQLGRVGIIYNRDVRVLRGGAFDIYPRNVRATLRGWDDGNKGFINRGFRFVKEIG